MFGDLGTATALFSKIHIVAENALTGPIYMLNNLLVSWAKLGGRKLLIQGLSNAFKALGAVMAPIKAAFKDIFPAVTGKQLLDLTQKFEKFTESLKPSPATVDGLRQTFKGLFAILDIGKQLLQGIFIVFGKVFGALSGGSGIVLTITGKLGDMIAAFDEALKKGGRLHDFFGD